MVNSLREEIVINPLDSVNRKTIIKHFHVYRRYNEIFEETKVMFPLLSNYIARSYYYKRLSDEFDLTVNYICSIVCTIEKNHNGFQRAYECAMMDCDI